MKLRDIIESIYNRSDMPQIDGGDLSDVVKLLRKASIPVEMAEVLPTQLKHSQKQVNKDKVKAIIRDLKRGKVLPPIAISSDGWIVDGHHRQLAYKILQPTNPIRVIKIGLGRDRAIEVYSKIEDHLEK